MYSAHAFASPTSWGAIGNLLLPLWLGHLLMCLNKHGGRTLLLCQALCGFYEVMLNTPLPLGILIAGLSQLCQAAPCHAMQHDVGLTYNRSLPCSQRCEQSSRSRSNLVTVTPMHPSRAQPCCVNALKVSRVSGKLWSFERQTCTACSKPWPA